MERPVTAGRAIPQQWAGPTRSQPPKTKAPPRSLAEPEQGPAWAACRAQLPRAEATPSQLLAMIKAPRPRLERSTVMTAAVAARSKIMVATTAATTKWVRSSNAVRHRRDDEAKAVLKKTGAVMTTGVGLRRRQCTSPPVTTMSLPPLLPWTAGGPVAAAVEERHSSFLRWSSHPRRYQGL